MKSGKTIELRGVSKRYGTFEAIPSLDLVVERGSFVSLLGPSGCGKTTTLRMIAGLEQPSGGDILVDGQRINDIEVHRRNFGMVFQNHALFPHKTAFDNVAFGLRYRGVPKAEIARRVREALSIVRLPHVEERLPSQLSGGQQQRIAVARAIVIEPDLLLFDEPLSALDAGLREEMRTELKRIQHTLGITTIFVTHDQGEALALSDKIVVMNGGRIEQEGTPDSVYSSPATAFVAGFFGHLNRFEGTVVRSDGHMSLVRLAHGEEVQVAASLTPGAQTNLCLRIERARIAPSFPTAPNISLLSGEVIASEYLGLMIRYLVRIGSTEAAVLQPRDGAILRPGQPVQVRIADDAWMQLDGSRTR